MIAKIIQIGNFRGIRIPKTLLEQTGFSDEVELEVKNNHIIIKPAQKPRKGWQDKFQTMAKKSDDNLMDSSELTRLNPWNDEEWEW